MEFMLVSQESFLFTNRTFQESIEHYVFPGNNQTGMLGKLLKNKLNQPTCQH